MRYEIGGGYAVGDAIDRVKERPVIWLVTAGSLAGAVLAVVNFGDTADAWIASEAEVDHAIYIHAQTPHAAALQMIAQAASERDEIRRESRCQTIELKITLIEQQIWEMEQDGTSPRLVEKKRELRDLEDKQSALKCSDFQ